jgi:hypothetical protein
MAELLGPASSGSLEIVQMIIPCSKIKHLLSSSLVLTFTHVSRRAEALRSRDHIFVHST